MKNISRHKISETRKCQLSDRTNHKPRHFFFRLFHFLTTVGHAIFRKILQITKKQKKNIAGITLQEIEKELLKTCAILP